MSFNVKNTLSELVLSAVFTMQQKNGVSLMQITDYIAEKRGCDANEIRSTIRMVLTKAKQHGILSESRGMYKLEPSYEDKLDKNELKTKKEDKDTEEDCEENGEGNDSNSQENENEKGKGNGKGNGKGKGNGNGNVNEETPPTCPTEADDDCQDDNDNDEEDEEDDDGEGDENCDEEQKDMEEPLPKKRKFYKNNQENDADEEDGWATQVEKLLWNLSKNK